MSSSSDDVKSQFHWADYSVLGGILVLLASMGVYFGFKVQSMAEYMTGSRKMGTIPVAVSLIASQLTGVLIISVPGEIYMHGAQYALIVFSLTLAILVINKAILPVFYENNIVNCYEYLELRFDRRLRKFQTLQFFVSALILLPVTLFIPSRVFAELTNTNVHVVNAIATATCVFYTMLGGVKAVVWTDVVQALVMGVSSFVVVTIGIRNVGNFWYVIHLAIEGGRFDVFDTTLDLPTRHTVWNILLGYTITSISFTALNPSSMFRIMSLPSLKQAKSTLSLFSIGYFFVVLLNCLTGLVIYAKYNQCDPIASNKIHKPDDLVPFFISQIIGHLPGLTGLFVACVFSAGLSTMSAHMNSISTVIYDDSIKDKVDHSEKKAKFTLKLIVVLIGIFCVAMGFVMETFGSILQLVLLVLNAVHGTTLGVYILGMWLPKTNRFGAFWAAVLSTISIISLVLHCQFNIIRGLVKIPNLPTSVEKCDLDDLVAMNRTTPITQNVEVPEGFHLNIAIPWFAVIGFVMTLVLGSLISFCTRNREEMQYKSTLVAKSCRRFIPKEILDFEMRQLDENENKTLLVS